MPTSLFQKKKRTSDENPRRERALPLAWRDGDVWRQ
jgi:hypothetical protein